jgi:hypothetical protein
MERNGIEKTSENSFENNILSNIPNEIKRLDRFRKNYTWR